MAKRKTKSAPRRRRRSVGGINSNQILMMVGGTIAGATLAGILSKTVLANKSPMVQALVPIAAGLATATFIKSDLGKFAGAGMIASGGTKLLQKFNLAGLGNDASFDVPLSISGDGLTLIAGDDDFAMAGDDDFAMAGDDGLSVLAGDDEY